MISDESQIGKTNINKLNETNKYNNINLYTNDIKVRVDNTNQNGKTEATPPSGKPPVEDQNGPNDSAPPSMPSLWRGVKIDLFRNGITKTGKDNFKLKLSVVKQDGTNQSLIAALNSPTYYIWRDVSQQEQLQPHWQVVKQVETKLLDAGVEYRCNKLCLPNKRGKTTKCVFMWQEFNQWSIVLVDRARQYAFVLDCSAQPTALQKHGNIIASKYFGKQAIAWVSEDDLEV